MIWYDKYWGKSSECIFYPCLQYLFWFLLWLVNTPPKITEFISDATKDLKWKKLEIWYPQTYCVLCLFIAHCCLSLLKSVSFVSVFLYMEGRTNYIHVQIQRTFICYSVFVSLEKVWLGRNDQCLAVTETLLIFLDAINVISVKCW